MTPFIREIDTESVKLIRYSVRLDASVWVVPSGMVEGGGGGGGVVSYPDPDSHSCGWITSRSGDVIHPLL